MQSPSYQFGFNRWRLVVVVVVLLAIVALVWVLIIRQATAPKKTVSIYPASNVSENIKFTGILNGTIKMGSRGGNYTCTTKAIGPIVGVVGSHVYSLSFTNAKGKGAGTYVGYATLATMPDLQDTFSGAVTLKINNDLRSGSVSGTLQPTYSTTQTIRVTGTWRCPGGI